MKFVLKKSKIISAIFTLTLMMCFLVRGSAVSICIPEIGNVIWVLLIVSLLLYAVINNFKIKKGDIFNNKEVFTLIILSLPSLIVNYSTINSIAWVKYYTAILLAYGLSLCYDKEILVKKYVKIMLFFATVSIILYVMFNYIKLPSSFLPVITKQTDSRVRYYSLFIYNIWIGESTRNCGPFWEPSIFAAYLVIALQFRCFFIKKDDHLKRDFIIIVFAILTTMSTGGYILLMITCLMIFWKNRKNNNVIIGVISLITIMLFILFLPMIENWLLSLNYEMFSKIFMFNERGTTLTRKVSFLTNIKIWSDNLLFGVGLNQIDFYYATVKELIGKSGLNAAQTSTSGVFLASMGICGIYYNYLWVKVTVKENRLNLMQKILFGICVFFIINETPHTYFVITYFIMFTLLKKGECKIENK